MPARFQVVFLCFYFSPTPRSYKKAFQSFRFGRFKVFRLGLFLWKSRTAVNIQCSARWRTRESKFRSLRHAQEEYIYMSSMLWCVTCGRILHKYRYCTRYCRGTTLYTVRVCHVFLLLDSSPKSSKYQVSQGTVSQGKTFSGQVKGVKVIHPH